MHDCSLLQIDSLAQQSGLNRIHAAIKMFVGIIALSACLLANTSWLIGLVALSMLLLTLKGGHLSLGRYLHVLMIPMAFVGLSSLGILLEISGAPIGFLNVPIGPGYLSITKSSWEKAIFAAIRSYGAVTCLSMITLSTPLSEIIGVLRKCRLPAIMIELMFLMYRYLTIMAEVHHHLFLAAQCRLGYRTYRSSLSSMCMIARNLLLISFRQAGASYDAMVARGYTGTINFWQPESFIRKRDILGAFSYFSLLVILLVTERMLK